MSQLNMFLVAAGRMMVNNEIGGIKQIATRFKVCVSYVLQATYFCLDASKLKLLYDLCEYNVISPSESSPRFDCVSYSRYAL
jgi:hypothetical protein